MVPALLTVRQTACILGVAPNTLYELIASDTAPVKAVRVSPRSIRFRRADVQAFLGVEIDESLLSAGVGTPP